MIISLLGLARVTDARSSTTSTGCTPCSTFDAKNNVLYLMDHSVTWECNPYKRMNWQCPIQTSLLKETVWKAEEEKISATQCLANKSFQHCKVEGLSGVLLASLCQRHNEPVLVLAGLCS